LQIRSLNQLRQIVRFAGVIMIVAHPFRKLLVGFGNLPMMLESVCKKTVFQKVDAIEVFNGRSKNEEIALARQISKKLALVGTGGSDAHTLQELGRCVTVFENSVKNEAELVAELKRGHFQAEYFRI
jgi:predicted metal-dependent phosphoesterase TrpH